MFLELLSGSLERGDKVVAFTQSLATLDVLAHLLSHPTWGGYLADPGGGRGGWAAGADFLRIEGADGALERHRKIEAFDAGDAGGGGGARVFLLSTRAGNMGVNLVAANRVVLFDTSWNPAVDRQALFRCFRFGQAKRVFIYRLVAEGFEARVFRRATQKDILARRVVDDEALERLYAFGDLTDARDDSASESEDEGAAAPPPPVADDVLRRTLEVWGELVASAAETDALFVENDDERLAEAERADAIDEYERERDGRPTRAQEESIAHARAEDAARTAQRQREREEMERDATRLLPAGWRLFRAPSPRAGGGPGRPYYHHDQTGRTVWRHPAAEQPATPPAFAAAGASVPPAFAPGLECAPRSARATDD